MMPGGGGADGRREWPDRDPLAHRAATTPERTAVIDARSQDGQDDGASRTDYRTYDAEVEALAAGLTTVDGLEPVREPGAEGGDGPPPRVAVLAADRAAVPRTLFAATRLGASVVPLNVRSDDERLVETLRRTDAGALLCDAPSATRAGALADVVGLDGVYDVAAVRERGRAAERSPADRSVDPDAERLVLFTSGTTGRPKGVRLTLRNLLASATGSAFRLGVLPGDRWLCSLPTYHMGGLAPWIRATLYGTAVVVGEAFDPGVTAAELREHDVTGVSLVPTMLVRLLDAGWEPPASLRFVLLGGGPADEALVERALDRDVPVCPTYGMTETASQIATALPETAGDHPGTVGQPLVTTAVTVVDEAGDPVEAGERGEVVVDGPTVTPGYLDDEVTGAAVSNHGLHTGDLGYRDADGRLRITGRVDDAFVSGGETVHPEAVATRLRNHPDVEDAAVVGLPDREWGRRVAAALVPGADVEPGHVVEDCATDLADYERPRRVLAVESLPRTASGTVDRSAVRERLAEDGKDV